MKKPNALGSEWVSLRKAALILDQPLSKVQRLKKDGHIAGIQFGTAFYVHRSELERLLSVLPPRIRRIK